MRREADRRRLLAGLAQSGRRPVRLPRRGVRRGAARLRARACSHGCASGTAGPTVDAIVITHFHLDHWGDLVPWVWGALYLHGRGDDHRRAGALGAARRAARSSSSSATLLGFPDMFERVFRLREYEPGVPFEAAGLRRSRRCACRTTRSRPTRSASPTASERSPTPATRPRAPPSSSSRATPTSSSARRPC